MIKSKGAVEFHVKFNDPILENLRPMDVVQFDMPQLKGLMQVTDISHPRWHQGILCRKIRLNDFCILPEYETNPAKKIQN